MGNPAVFIIRFAAQINEINEGVENGGRCGFQMFGAGWVLLDFMDTFRDETGFGQVLVDVIGHIVARQFINCDIDIVAVAAQQLFLLLGIFVLFCFVLFCFVLFWNRRGREYYLVSDPTTSDS
ncbi:hypothetical protein AYI68_g2474 [Smittium mucronatum]|uniref:Uncharacterized protein n=1 Tax=Smittium mucronatum TaxID=133383 RepID=A0A1R0H2J8_9FUNG|nr:hypothetical protein AYI68_g2474 [Smittium mucronatum]